MNSTDAQHRTAPAAIAEAIVAGFDAGSPLEPLSDRFGTDVPAAYRIAGDIRRAREARGERHVGRKIGFSNRTIWHVYGIDAPMWGDMFAHTVRDVSAGAEVRLGPLREPRIEPEIAFGLATPPAPEMSDAEVLGCCAWVAHGFEIVHSPFPGWKFRTADSIAVGGLHGMLLLGPRYPTGPEWLGPLSDFTCRLLCNGDQRAEGHSSVVLDGPLRALRHLAALLAADPDSAPLAAGEIVTTGTLTDAFPIAPGERWSTELAGLALPGLEVKFV